MSLQTRQKICRILDKALIGSSITAAAVEETKTFLGLLPIFGSTIMLNCCLAQLQTFSVQQGNIMNMVQLQNPRTIIISTSPFNHACFHTIIREYGTDLWQATYGKDQLIPSTWENGNRTSTGVGSMAVAAIVEAWGRKAAENNVALSVFWLGWQYLLLGVSDMLTFGGMLEFSTRKRQIA